MGAQPARGPADTPMDVTEVTCMALPLCRGSGSRGCGQVDPGVIVAVLSSGT